MPSSRVSFVVRGLVTVAIPVVISTAALQLLDSLGYGIPFWVAVCIQALSTPIFFTIGIWYRLWSINRRAKQAGAILPPRWKGKWIGDYDLLVKFQELYRHGYIGGAFIKRGSLRQPGTGTYYTNVIYSATYYLSDPAIIKTILATDFNTWVKGDAFKSAMDSVLGTGVFNADGEMWKFHRTMTRPFFSRDRISHFELFDRHAETAISKLRERLRLGISVDFQDLISRFTLDSATEFLFGACVHSLEAELPYPTALYPQGASTRSLSKSEDFARAFSQAQDIISNRLRIGWVWPLFELFEDKTAKPMKIVNDYIDPIVKQALDKAKREKAMGNGRRPDVDTVEEGETLLDHLVNQTSDFSVVHDETLNILIAGRDTTAGTLTYTIYLLSQHPDVLQRLRREILDTVGHTRRPTYDDVRTMKYLRAVINETLRLFPAVPWDIRFPVKDTILPNPDPNGKPFFVPAHVGVSYSVWLMHRRKDLWGPDAEEFDPDRWLDERVHKYVTPNPFIFLPFNAGPRICLGQQFAYNEMSFFLIRLLQNFTCITHDVDAQDPATRRPEEWAKCPGRKGKDNLYPKAHLTLYVHGGLWVKMKEENVSEF
ncbi:cytochrome P450 monooxygenase pc-2 [Panus rudis PR-1116 ss-1]|nr:cytochrome P450 monooxygenase pc-2 [Panus rudis PR-1116 ss-1]